LNFKKIAVVGISDKPFRDSFVVASYMKNNNYVIYPVNPNCSEVLGLKCHATLLELEEEIDLVDIFRRSEFVLPVVEQAIEIGAKAVWMQLGVINEEAAQKALDGGLKVVMNRCWKQEYQHYQSETK
jgi:predicted CoA-binding protein